MGAAGGAERQAMAQAPSAPRELPGAVEPGRDRPLPEVPTQPDFDYTIEQPGRSQVPRAVQELHFILTGIKIEVPSRCRRRNSGRSTRTSWTRT